MVEFSKGFTVLINIVKQQNSMWHYVKLSFCQYLDKRDVISFFSKRKRNFTTSQPLNNYRGKYSKCTVCRTIQEYM